jgi:membrane protease YdiL (CAAX protease family)
VRRDYWRRLVSPSRIAPVWAAVIALPVPTLTGLSALVDRLLGGTGLQLEAAASLLQRPLAILPFLAFVLLFGPLPEEMGWRGYALHVEWTALASSLRVGLAWALWHLPLFLIEGTYQHGLGLGTGRFWAFMVVIPPSRWSWPGSTITRGVPRCRRCSSISW